MLVLNLTNPPEVAMPNVVGLSKEEAQKEIENVKLKFEIEKEEYNKRCARRIYYLTRSNLYGKV